MERFQSALERMSPISSDHNTPTSISQYLEAYNDQVLRSKLNAETVLSPAIDTLTSLTDLLRAPVVLAGGAVRDALLERDIKDYDLFVAETVLIGTDAGDLADKIEDHLDLPIGAISVLYTYEDCETPFGQEVNCIMNWNHPENGIECQLIFLKGFSISTEPKEFTDRLDFNICRAALTTQGWHIDTRFFVDVRTKRFTFDDSGRSGAALDFDRSQRRFSRLHNKYPGYLLATSTERTETHAN